MPINPQTGEWQPNLAPKQLEIFNCYKPYLLVSGPRRSSKSIGCLHKILRHAWETPQARVAMFSHTVKSAQAGGVWSDLTDTVLPEWLEANIGMRLTVEPKVDGATRLHYFCVSNAFGGTSRVQLHSLDYDFDIETAVKGMRFSLVYFSELSNFRNRIVFTTTEEQLRMPHLKPSQHQWIGDTNPSDEGNDSWIYKLWYVERVAEDHPNPRRQEKFELIEIMIDDNIFLSQEEKDDIKARYAHDQNLTERYVNGLWTTRTEAGHFTDVFRPDVHVLGNVNKFDEKEWELLLPSDNCAKMVSGWDMGSKNHSAHIIERLVQDEITYFHVIDEIVSLNSPLPIWDFTEVFLEQMEEWEQYIANHCHKNPIEWAHWSDMSAFDQFRAALGTYDHQVVALASRGKIVLKGTPKGKHSIMTRVDIVHRLLYQNRLFISAKCVKTIQMLGAVKKGKTKFEVVEDTPFRHVFDSLSYALAGECWNELGEKWIPIIGQPGNLVSVRF